MNNKKIENQWNFMHDYRYSLNKGPRELNPIIGFLIILGAIIGITLLISHANDSCFWVVPNFSDIDATTTLKVYSSSTIVMGLVIFSCVWIESQFIL